MNGRSSLRPNSVKRGRNSPKFHILFLSKGLLLVASLPHANMFVFPFLFEVTRRYQRGFSQYFISPPTFLANSSQFLLSATSIFNLELQKHKLHKLCCSLWKMICTKSNNKTCSLVDKSLFFKEKYFSKICLLVCNIDQKAITYSVLKFSEFCISQANCMHWILPKANSNFQLLGNCPIQLATTLWLVHRIWHVLENIM